MIEADSETNNVTQIGKKPFFEICFLKKRIIPNGVKKIMQGNIMYDKTENRLQTPPEIKFSKNISIPLSLINP